MFVCQSQELLFIIILPEMLYNRSIKKHLASDFPVPAWLALSNKLRDKPYGSHCIVQPPHQYGNESNTFNISNKITCSFKYCWLKPFVTLFEVHHDLHTNRVVRVRAYHLSVIDMRVPLLQTWFLLFLFYFPTVR